MKFRVPREPVAGFYYPIMRKRFLRGWVECTEFPLFLKRDDAIRFLLKLRTVNDRPD